MLSARFVVTVSGPHCRVGIAHHLVFRLAEFGGQCPPYEKEGMQQRG